MDNEDKMQSVREKFAVKEEQPNLPEKKAGVSPSKILVFGILSLAFAETFILGIIFGALSLKNAKQYAVENAGKLPDQAKTGRTLGKVGIILSIVFLVLEIAGAIAYNLFFNR